MNCKVLALGSILALALVGCTDNTTPAPATTKATPTTGPAPVTTAPAPAATAPTTAAK